MKDFLNPRACKLITSDIIRKQAWKEIPFQKETKNQTHLTSKLLSPEVWQNPCGTIGQTQNGAALFYQASWHVCPRQACPALMCFPALSSILEAWSDNSQSSEEMCLTPEL